MDIVEIKFTNMKKLCYDIDPDNEWIRQLQDVPLSAFIATIKAKSHLSENDIYQTLIEKSQIDAKKLVDHETKIRRYIEYFHEISKII